MEYSQGNDSKKNHGSFLNINLCSTGLIFYLILKTSSFSLKPTPPLPYQDWCLKLLILFSTIFFSQFCFKADCCMNVHSIITCCHGHDVEHRIYHYEITFSDGPGRYPNFSFCGILIFFMCNPMLSLCWKRPVILLPFLPTNAILTFFDKCIFLPNFIPQNTNTHDKEEKQGK